MLLSAGKNLLLALSLHLSIYLYVYLSNTPSLWRCYGLLWIQGTLTQMDSQIGRLLQLIANDTTDTIIFYSADNGLLPLVTANSSAKGEATSTRFFIFPRTSLTLFFHISSPLQGRIPGQICQTCAARPTAYASARLLSLRAASACPVSSGF
jgi:hypothetical protein